MTKITLPSNISDQVAQALAEDVGAGDITASLIPEQAKAKATVITRERAVICGQAWFDAVFRQLDSSINITWHVSEGDLTNASAILCELTGPARPILTGERTALNFLQTLSATATVTRRYADALRGTQTRVLDTRKTLPGLRLAQKYAVRCGGGANHRVGLFDAVLVKENHIAAAGSIPSAVQRARAAAGTAMVEVEVENLDELKQALATDIDRVLLDNFSLQDLRQAVALTRASSTRVELEASGNVTLETIGNIAATGVDFVSVGGLTKHVEAIDLSMRFEMRS